MTGQAEARLAVIVLTREEAANLPALLASLDGLDCRVLVVDSGSTDATVAIAETAGCTVVSHPFANYAAQRNWAFDQLPITTPWVLSLDADERLTPEFPDEIAGVVAADDPAGAVDPLPRPALVPPGHAEPGAGGRDDGVRVSWHLDRSSANPGPGRRARRGS